MNIATALKLEPALKLQVIDGDRVKWIPLAMFQGMDTQLETVCVNRLGAMIEWRGIRIGEIIQIFRGTGLANISHKHLDYLVSAWIITWHKKGSF